MRSIGISEVAGYITESGTPSETCLATGLVREGVSKMRQFSGDLVWSLV